LQENRVVERMVENIAAGVVSLDTAGKVVMANRVAIEMLGVEVGDSIAEVVAAKASLEPVLAFLRRRPEVGPLAETIQLEDAEGEQRDWSLVWVPLPGQGEPSALLVVEEVTEVLRGQRLEAWAEMARMIAHEIKNPLTPIRLSTEHMQQVYAENPKSFKAVFESCTSNILRQVDELQEIASDFSTYSRIPKIELSSGDLGNAVGEICEAYRSASPAGIELTYRSDPDCSAVEFDAKLLGRAIRNIIENAIRVTRSGGRIDVEVQAEADRVEILIADSGPGVGAEVLPRIFDPYFSTHASGTGLGLPIARRIVEEHGGTISARNRPGSGLEVSICLPASDASSGDDASPAVR
ncbi:MAG: ATP-binding protein, partial [Acidobacteriota bacterium]